MTHDDVLLIVGAINALTSAVGSDCGRKQHVLGCGNMGYKEQYSYRR
jgi:hypothetical protein